MPAAINTPINVPTTRLIERSLVKPKFGRMITTMVNKIQ